MTRFTANTRGYIVAVLAVAFAASVHRFLLGTAFGQQFPFVLLMIAVIAATWIGGSNAGVLALALGAAASYLLANYFRTGDSFEFTQLRVVFFLIFGGLAIYWIGQLEAQQKRLADEVEIRHRAELALREREERIRMAVESAAIGTWDLNVQTGQRQWSDRTKMMFGLPLAEDPSPLTLVDLLHPDDRLRTGTAIQSALDPAGDGRYEVDYRTVWKDGTVRWVVAKGQAFFEGKMPNRRAVRFIGTVLDFTERKEIEQALKDADRRKDEFLGMLAHELRNPLAPISYALELWPTIDNDRSRTEQLRGMMQRQVEHMIRLIDDLMDVARITSGKIDLRSEQLDLCRVVSGAVESIQPLAQDRGHQLKLALPADPIFVDGDAVRLGQVFGNILNNAAKFTPPGGAISVLVERDGAAAAVTVRDNGQGIPPNMLSEIFNDFRQIDATLERAQGGLGIGLTLVKRLTEMHAGTVDVRSEGVGRGSEFVVTLPARAGNENGLKRDNLHAAHRLEPVPRHRVLVADDLPEVAESFAMLLDVVGQEVLRVNDGRSAIDTALAERPDVVFLDLAMPGMDGYEVARQLRTHQDLKGMTLVALTGYGQPEAQKRALESGFDHFLTKPTSLEMLRELLRSLPIDGQRPPCHAGSSIV